MVLSGGIPEGVADQQTTTRRVLRQVGVVLGAVALLQVAAVGFALLQWPVAERSCADQSFFEPQEYASTFRGGVRAVRCEYRVGQQEVDIVHPTYPVAIVVAALVVGIVLTLVALRQVRRAIRSS
ncbi:MAG: hypothetical protein ACRC35_01480 [Angustibacter sp.]